MNKKDRILLRLVTIAFAIFVLLLAYFGYQLGKEVEQQSNYTHTNIEAIYKDLDIKQKQIDAMQSHINKILSNIPKDGRDGSDGTDGVNGKDGATIVENHETTTIIEKEVPVEPRQGNNGKTPEFAIDNVSNKLMMRYQGDEEWHIIPILCENLTVVCEPR